MIPFRPPPITWRSTSAAKGVKVESENEHLTARGERIHPGDVGAAEPPVRRELHQALRRAVREVPDLRRAAEHLRPGPGRFAESARRDWPTKVDWHMAWFGDAKAFAVELGAAPREVESVVNYRLLNGGVFVAHVSGGVQVKPNELVNRKAIQVEKDTGGNIQQKRPGNAVETRGPTAGGGTDFLGVREFIPA